MTATKPGDKDGRGWLILISGGVAVLGATPGAVVVAADPAQRSRLPERVLHPIGGWCTITCSCAQVRRS